MRIRILDKYIFREVFNTFVFAMCAFSIVFIGSGTLFRIARFITDYGASFSSIVKIFVYSLPSVVIWTFPMSMLLTSLLTFGRMSGSSEITAMKSCGIGFLRIATPAIILGFVISIFAIWFNEQIVPWANTAYARVVDYEIKGNTKPMSQDHIILKDVKNGQISRIIYARQYDSSTERMVGVNIQMFENGKAKQVENAEYAEWGDNVWTMHNGVVYDIVDDSAAGKDGKQPGKHTMNFKTQVLPVEMSPRDVLNQQKKPEEMTIKELREAISIMQSQFVKTKKFETELYQRFTVPLASLIFTLVGVPLGLQPNRHSSSMGFATSIVIIFGYYSLMVMGSAIGNGGLLPPAIAVWLPNFVGIVAGSYLMRKASK